jgi:hypothetical protein
MNVKNTVLNMVTAPNGGENKTDCSNESSCRTAAIVPAS